MPGEPEHWKQRAQVLTDKDKAIIANIVRDVISVDIHPCIHIETLTPERVGALVEMADLSIEVKADTKKAAIKTLKWVLILAALTALVGMIISPIMAFWLKVRAALSALA